MRCRNDVPTKHDTLFRRPVASPHRSLEWQCPGRTPRRRQLRNYKSRREPGGNEIFESIECEEEKTKNKMNLNFDQFFLPTGF